MFIPEKVQRTFSLTAPCPSPGWNERLDQMERIRGDVKEQHERKRKENCMLRRGRGRKYWETVSLQLCYTGLRPCVAPVEGQVGRWAPEEPSALPHCSCTPAEFEDRCKYADLVSLSLICRILVF